MRAGRLFLALSFAVALGACNDTTGIGEVTILEDTVVLAAPSAAAADTLPTALDVTVGVLGGSIGGGRFPERVADVEQWDLALRVRDGELRFFPPRALGFNRGTQSRAAITRPMTGRTMDEVREAPASNQFLADSSVAVVQGAVYVVRSRPAGCYAPFYAKIRPLEVNVAAGTVRLAVATTTPCGDLRLVAKD